MTTMDKNKLLAEVPEAQRSLVKEQVEELQTLGITVDKITVTDKGGAPKLEFKFPRGEQHFKVRTALEKAGFDVGSKMGGETISFFAAKRTKPSEGWEV